MERLECKKAYFYAELSHDLRQPLQAMKIFIALLEEENLNERQAELTAQIKNSASGLEAWLDNLLAITRLESGGLKRQDEEFSLDEFLKKIAGEYREITAYKKLRFLYSGNKITLKTDKILFNRIYEKNYP